MPQLVLLRHGQSTFNRDHEFTGWTDIDLTRQGITNARKAAHLLKAHGFIFDVAHTSVLKRAIRTLWIALDELDLMWIPVKRSWKLNERHYGALQAVDKEEMGDILGGEKVHEWRRSFDVRPPKLQQDDERHARHDPKYNDLTQKQIPETESLKDCIKRVMEYWKSGIVPDLKKNKRVIIVAHGNSLRALVKYLDSISDKDIVNLNIPTATPLVYELDKKLKPKRHYYLGNLEEIQKAMEKTAKEGSK